MLEASVSAIEGGFSDQVLDAQTVFRAVMDAMARPGSVRPLRALPRPPQPLSATAGAVALALCDHDTPMWLDPALTISEAPGAWFAFHTGAPIVKSPADAHFVFVSRPAEFINFENFAQGTQEYPDRSATVVLQMESFSSGEQMILEGPGIRDRAEIAPSPMPRHFVEQWRQNRERFPRGIDLILAGPDAVACLPRTTRIVTEG
jgi:alpha-D-ribose 1-methylphosphonate 5-triphosphate synthase subunit PhnH